MNKSHPHNMILLLWNSDTSSNQTCHYAERGVLRKRPNFLNSAPTSIESALRLLSAPSVSFWQQTAICLVSLWALVVELHPLNWALYTLLEFSSLYSQNFCSSYDLSSPETSIYRTIFPVNFLWHEMTYYKNLNQGHFNGIVLCTAA
jgi:hypothetical protein